MIQGFSTYFYQHAFCLSFPEFTQPVYIVHKHSHLLIPIIHTTGNQKWIVAFQQFSHLLINRSKDRKLNGSSCIFKCDNGKLFVTLV